MLGSLGVEAFRYHRWANLHLLDACAALTDEQRELTAPGTYGTVAATLLHLVGAEQRYLARFTGEEPKVGEKRGFPGVETLRAVAAESGDRLIDIAGRVDPDEEFDTTFANRPHRLRKGIVLLQALHHGNDHRTHVCTVLGYHGIEYGDMDVWSYGEAIGALVQC